MFQIPDESERNIPPYKISDDQAEEADQLWKRVWEARNNEWSHKNHFGASFKPNLTEIPPIEEFEA